MSIPFLASRLKHKMILQEQVHTPDTAGGYTVTWQEVAQLWGEIVAIGGAPYFGREQVFGKKIEAMTRYKITLRYRRRVSADMRILVEDKTLRILAVVEPLGIKKTLEILAEEYT